MLMLRRASSWILGLTIVLLARSVPGADPPQRTVPSPQLPIPPTTILRGDATPIDLASALRLAGVQNAELLLARERVTAADAERQFAAAQFLPTLNAGTNLDLHTGPLQRAVGAIQKVNRGSLYLGLGAGAVGAGTVNVPGVVWKRLPSVMPVMIKLP